MNYLTVALSSTAVYLFIIVAIRLFGKKELTQLSVIDLVFILLISNAVQNAMVDGTKSSLIAGVIAAGTLFILNYILKLFLFKSKLFTRALEGEPIMLVHKGDLVIENLAKQRITLAEIEAAAREHGVESIKDVDLAVLEIDGNISILSHDYQKKSMRKRKAHKVLRQTT